MHGKALDGPYNMYADISHKPRSAGSKQAAWMCSAGVDSGCEWQRECVSEWPSEAQCRLQAVGRTPLDLPRELGRLPAAAAPADLQH